MTSSVKFLVRSQPVEKRATLANEAPYHDPLYRSSDGFFPGMPRSSGRPACNLFSDSNEGRRLVTGHLVARLPDRREAGVG